MKEVDEGPFLHTLLVLLLAEYYITVVPVKKNVVTSYK